MANEKCKPEGYRAIPKLTNCQCSMFCSFMVDSNSQDAMQVKDDGNLSFHNNYSFLKKVDQLPTGPSWSCEIVKIDGDRVGDDGQKDVGGLGTLDAGSC